MATCWCVSREARWPNGDKLIVIAWCSYLEAIPGLGSLSARSLTGGDTQHLGGHANGSLKDTEREVGLDISSTGGSSANVVNGPQIEDAINSRSPD